MSLTDSRFLHPTVFPFHSHYEVSIMADTTQTSTTQAQQASSGSLMETVKATLVSDANRWETLTRFIKRLQNNDSGISIYDIDAKTLKQIDEHVAGLRGLAKLIVEAPVKAETPSANDKSRFQMIELE